MQGKFIVFEGVEGCGKTTQLARSQQWLTASHWLARLSQALPESTQPLIVTREPGGTELGTSLRKLLLSPEFFKTEPIQDRSELLLYAADRAQHVETLLKPHLMQGALILCDRYTDSTVAYQGYGRGLSLELIDQLNQIATGGLESDLTLWLDLEVEAGLARAQQRRKDQGGPLDRIEAVNLAFHQRVQKGFEILAQQYPDRIIRIDAHQSEATVAAEIQAILSQRLSAWYPQPSQP
jgi:dTMP kinase